ncbi:MAG TPA: glycosyltransferase family A protein [Pyrinomonadaceae bacterium]|nr:glycosyltransferase family A protein [Pyrinomonadaceae bacterium]HMP66852.1 glycosyltransferase family A protein [Pyrinomonadaceae bacterium]
MITALTEITGDTGDLPHNAGPVKEPFPVPEPAEPPVSVIIPAYEVTEYIAETLDSVLAQSYENFEIVVVNDGCPDTVRLDAVLEPYLDKISYIKQPNTGASGARNTGIRNSTGEIIAFLDGDDIWYPDYLASQVAELRSRKLDLVYCDALLFGDPLFDGKSYSEQAPSSGEVTFDSLLMFECCPILSGTIARRQAIESVDGFAPELRRAMDFDLWLRLANDGAEMGYQRKLLLKYRVRRDGITGDSVRRVEREIELIGRFQRIFELNEEQETKVEKLLAGLNADRNVAVGKAYLVEGNYRSAITSLKKANEHRRSVYLSLIILALKYFPRMFRRIYVRVRRDEIRSFPHFVRQTAGSGPLDPHAR